MEVEIKIQMSVSAYLVTKEIVLETRLDIFHKEAEQLKGKRLILWLADLWITLAVTNIIGLCFTFRKGFCFQFLRNSF